MRPTRVPTSGHFEVEPLEDRRMFASAVEALAATMDQYHDAYDVYSDVDAAGNHFVARAAIYPDGGAGDVPAMTEDFSAQKHSGLTSIAATFTAKANNYGGWLFLNGTLNGTQKLPELNFGTVPNAGVDLTGATTLTFWARGAKGGEKVKFFALGVGRAPGTSPPAPHPDSAPEVNVTVTLGRQWKRFTLSLSGLDLSYVLGGFGWVAEGRDNAPGPVRFYMDDISYDKPRLSEPRLLQSFVPKLVDGEFDRLVRNSASTYDNSIAVLALLAAGEDDRAGLIADALVYAQQHDSLYSDGRLRNSYMAGDIGAPPGWRPRGKAGAARLPGYYDRSAGRFVQDNIQVGSSAGSQAWAMLALVAFAERSENGQAYLDAAVRLGNWVHAQCRDRKVGYTAGFGDIRGASRKLLYKSAEHNIALAAAFAQLHRLTGAEQWNTRATRARAFVISMFEPSTGHFLSGTDTNGRKSFDVTPVDVQALGTLLLADADSPYGAAIAFAQRQLRTGKGFDFNADRDGIWYEGTAQMALAFFERGRVVPGQALLQFLHASQTGSGALTAANKDRLTTGFFLKTDLPSLYYRRSHTGSTAWLVLAELRSDPFEFSQ